MPIVPNNSNTVFGVFNRLNYVQRGVKLSTAFHKVNENPYFCFYNKVQMK